MHLHVFIFSLLQGLLLSASWVFYYGVLCAIAPNLWWFLFLRFALGIGLGSLPLASTYGMEFLQTNIRARGVQGIEIIYSMGGSLATLLAVLLIEPYGWRFWLLVCATPCLIFLILSTCAPESPRFYLISGQPGKSKEVMQMIARFNQCQVPPQELYAKQEKNRGKAWDLFKPEHRKLTIPLLAIWFIMLFVYYGAVLLITETIKLGSTCGSNSLSLDIKPPQEPTCALECKGPDSSQLADIFYTSLAELPATVAVAFLADWCGRKHAFIICFLGYTLSAILLCFCIKGTIMMIVLSTWRGFGIVVTQLAFLYTSEAYPTHVRTTGIGLLNSVGRIGGLTTPFIAQVLSRYSMSLSFIIYAAISFLGAVCAFLLPIETNGRILA